jgi:hypothetical protein
MAPAHAGRARLPSKVVAGGTDAAKPAARRPRSAAYGDPAAPDITREQECVHRRPAHETQPTTAGGRRDPRSHRVPTIRYSPPTTATSRTPACAS